MRLRHWQVLNEVRAIENQLFLCAVNGCGTIGRVQSTGHSAVYDPWGTNLLEMDTNEGIASVDIDLTVVEDIRNKINLCIDGLRIEQCAFLFLLCCINKINDSSLLWINGHPSNSKHII